MKEFIAFSLALMSLSAAAGNIIINCPKEVKCTWGLCKPMHPNRYFYPAQFYHPSQDGDYFFVGADLGGTQQEACGYTNHIYSHEVFLATSANLEAFKSATTKWDKYGQYCSSLNPSDCSFVVNHS